MIMTGIKIIIMIKTNWKKNQEQPGANNLHAFMLQELAQPTIMLLCDMIKRLVVQHDSSTNFYKQVQDRRSHRKYSVKKGALRNQAKFTEKTCAKDSFTVSEYPFKQNKNMFKYMIVLLSTYFHNISLNVLRSTFFSIYNLPFLRSPNIGEIRVKVGPKTNYFFYIQSSCTNRIAVFNNFSIIH